MNFFANLPKRMLVALIMSYQTLLSPDHSWLKYRFPHGYCRFYPSCSQYATEAIERFGAFKGMVLAVMRLSRCHPWSQPKVDAVPGKFYTN